MPIHIESTVATYPRHPYEAMATAVLGKAYDVTLVFVGETRAQQLNLESRGKSYVPNVLSFPIEKNLGEIYICPRVAKKEAKKFNLSVRGYVAYLFIHGLLHLKGYDHGATMDKLERQHLKRFGIT